MRHFPIFRKRVRGDRGRKIRRGGVAKQFPHVNHPGEAFPRVIPGDSRGIDMVHSRFHRLRSICYLNYRTPSRVGSGRKTLPKVKMTESIVPFPHSAPALSNEPIFSFPAEGKKISRPKLNIQNGDRTRVRNFHVTEKKTCEYFSIQSRYLSQLHGQPLHVQQTLALLTTLETQNSNYNNISVRTSRH